MGLMINTNIEAYDAHRNLVGTENALAKSMQRLSSGLRINSAADDAAGLAISQKLTGQVNGLGQAQRNAQDGVSLVQTAEGSLNQVHAMLQRVRELAVQYQNGTLAASDKTAIVCEVDQLGAEIDRIGRTAQFNGIALFSSAATAQTINFQVGANDGEQISVTTQSMGTMVAGNGAAGAISLGSTTALATIDTAISAVSAQRAQFGAVQNRLQYTLGNLATYEENLTSSLSRIRDVDMASEMVNFTKSQILAQAGTSMLAQANSAPQSVLKLLQ
jgi:flagellin